MIFVVVVGRSRRIPSQLFIMNDVTIKGLKSKQRVEKEASYPCHFKLGEGNVVAAPIPHKPLSQELVVQVLKTVCLPGQYGSLPQTVIERACALSEELTLDMVKKIRTLGMIRKRIKVKNFENSWCKVVLKLSLRLLMYRHIEN